ncbi:uncharacterized protein FTOL_13390 [Fusarium torulosum]|uniref:CBM-cenC domain-containing protein n=1 Tax=Fusarium torulosum TaxID=33205 RepID=A0AAE8MMF4_9HYPO|nr:uncharacterized protein FTOL_13390 [Fusarium torulosum]
MKVSVVSITFTVLALCSGGHASPCKPKSSSASTTDVLTATSAISTAESSSTEVLFTSTEIPSSTVPETTSTDFSTTVITSADTTTSVELIKTTTAISSAETTTISEESAPTQIFVNPSFDEQSSSGAYDGSPWTFTDSSTTSVVGLNSDPSLAHSGSYSAYWSVTTISQRSRVVQTVSLVAGETYTLSYWWFVNQDQQPTNNVGCYIAVQQTQVSTSMSTYPEFFPLTVPLPLKSWTKRDVAFTGKGGNTELSIFVFCNAGVSDGLKVAIDDITLYKNTQ